MRSTLHSVRFAVGVTACAIAAVFSGCGGELGSDPAEEASALEGEASPIGVAEQAILKGTPVGDDIARGEGIILIRTARPSVTSVCTGALVRNDMVLTARHCVTADGQINGTIVSPDLVFISLAAENGGIKTITELGNDAVLLRTASLFPMNGSRYDYKREVGQSTNAWLVGKFVNCYGYGRTGTATEGQLHTARLKVTASTSTTVSVSKNSLGQLPAEGDSGGPCFTDDRAIAGVISKQDGSVVKLVGPEVIRGVKGMTEFPFTGVARSSSANTAANFFRFDASFPTSASHHVYTVTPNWNPPGGGSYHNHHIGLWHTGSQWSIFNQDSAAMTLGSAFNVTYANDQVLGGRGRVHVASAGNTNGQMTRLDIPELNGKSNAIFFVTPNWQPQQVYNNHAVGVFYDGASWHIFNEDLAPMPLGAAFNIQLTGPEDITLVHRALSSNVDGHSTFINNRNLNDQPNATFFVTHNWSAGGSLYNRSPIGVWYDSSRGRWAIFNQDGALMPLTAFNILIRP